MLTVRFMYVADNRRRVLFCPAFFMKNVLGDNRINCPGLMFTGAGIVNYDAFIATCFPDAGHDHANSRDWRFDNGSFYMLMTVRINEG